MMGGCHIGGAEDLPHNGSSRSSFMPVPACIAQAAEDYRHNDSFLLNSVQDLAPEEWVKRPSEMCNHVAWIVGHVIWARTAILSRLGAKWSAPWLGMFARGGKLDEGAAY